MKCILFADDDRATRAAFKRVFEDEGFEVILARDGAEALGLLESERPDAVVLDIYMPGKDGFEVAEEIQAFAPELPIVLYTGHDDACTRDRRSRFALACVEKQTDMTELKRAIFRVLSSAHDGSAFRTGLPPASH